MSQPYGKFFALERIPDSLVRKLDCRIRQNMHFALELPLAPDRLGNFYAVVTILWGRGRKSGQILTQVWARESKDWKLVTWQLQDPFSMAAAPEAGEAEPEPSAETPVQSEPADPALVRTIDAFLDDWLLRRNFEKAATYFAPDPLTCADFESGHLHTTPARQERTELRQCLAALSAEAGRKDHLDDLILSVPLWHVEMEPASHPASN